jgi:hypothetical protein
MKHICVFLCCTLFLSFTHAQSTDQEKYDSLKTAWLKGKKNYKIAPWIISMATELKQKGFAQSLASDYIDNYLSAAALDEFLSEQNLMLVFRFNNSTSNQAFKKYYQYSARIDSIMQQPNFAENYIDIVIGHADIDPVLKKDHVTSPDSPEWTSLENKIAAKFDKQTAIRAVLKQKIRIYEKIKDTAALVSCYSALFEKVGMDTTHFGKMFTNNVNYYIFFLHTEDPVVLKKAIGWSEYVLSLEPNNGAFRDTYANLLYKTGRKKEAIDNEIQAAQDAPEDRDIKANFEKMRKGERTW